MEPALDERGDLPSNDHPLMPAPTPQWSPLSTSGATIHHSRTFVQLRGRNGARSRRAGRLALDPGAELPAGAAMEPALDERGDSVTLAGIWSTFKEPQWSPLSTSGATRPRSTCTRPRVCRNGARSRRAGRRPRDHGRAASPPGRNGARSRRAGRPGQALLAPVAAAKPQWSPLSTSGATLAQHQPRQRPDGAAMEPALDERGDHFAYSSTVCQVLVPQWSPLSTSGATHPLPGPLHHQRVGRNGARSRRAGRQAGVVGGHQGSTAAMEPALDERGDARRRLVAVISARTPQWSPLSTSGATTS